MFSKLARILVVPAVVAALGIPAIAASASPARPASPAVTGNEGYYYAEADDSGNSSGHAGEQVSADFYVQPETVPINAHSITEFYVEDSNFNAVEFGIDTEPGDFGDSSQYMWAATWTAGVDNYDIGADGYAGPDFHSTSSTKLNTALTDDQWDLFGVNYTGGQVQLWLNGSEIGYIPGADWPGGGWKGNAQVEAYGEAFNPFTGGTLPTMNGGIKNFYGDGTTLTNFLITSPYSIHSTSPTGFTFSGPS